MLPGSLPRLQHLRRISRSLRPLETEAPAWNVNDAECALQARGRGIEQLLQDHFLIGRSVKVAGDLEQPLELGGAFRQRLNAGFHRQRAGHLPLHAVQQGFERTPQFRCVLRGPLRRLFPDLLNAKHAEECAVRLLEGYGGQPGSARRRGGRRCSLQGVSPLERMQPARDRRYFHGGCVSARP